MTPMTSIHEDQHCSACNVGQDPFSADQKRDACRYYQTGSCRRGSSCPFSHLSVASSTETTTPHPVYQAEQMYTYHPLGQTPAYHPLGLHAHPAFLWQPYLPYSPSFDPRYAHACQAETLLDYPDDKSDPSSAESSSAATSRDYQLCMALDATLFDGLRDMASPPRNLGINSRPQYASYGGPVFSGNKSEHVVGQPATTGHYPGQYSTVVASPSLQWQDDSKKKPLAYKTKPCKFYMKNGKCTSGEKCTFIHDSESIGSVDKSPTEPTPATGAKLPPKPLNKYEACRETGYYPITWRVIGGGVMMGGQRKQCPAFAAGNCKYGDDCALAHETELDTDRVGFIELKNEAFRKEGSAQRSAKGSSSKRARSSSQKPKSIKVSSVETQQSENERFPSTVSGPQRSDATPDKAEAVGKKESEVVRPGARDAPTSPVHRRTQSMSMVVGSPLPLDKTHPNYAAEL